MKEPRTQTTNSITKIHNNELIMNSAIDNRLALFIIIIIITIIIIIVIQIIIIITTIITTIIIIIIVVVVRYHTQYTSIPYYHIRH